MTLSKNNLAMNMVLLLYILAISTTSATTCTSTSPDCCWVVESWNKMGKATTVNPNSATACCYRLGSTTQSSGIPGVRCTSTGIVSQIDWKTKSLKGQIPEELVKLTYLQRL